MPSLKRASRAKSLPAEYEPPPRADQQKLGANQRQALDVLTELHAEQTANLRRAGYQGKEARVRLDDWEAASNLDRRRWREVLDSLQQKRLVRVEAPYVTLP